MYMLQVANLLGAEYVDAITDVNDVIQFETALADVSNALKKFCCFYSPRSTT